MCTNLLVSASFWDAKSQLFITDSQYWPCMWPYSCHRNKFCCHRNKHLQSKSATVSCCRRQQLKFHRNVICNQRSPQLLWPKATSISYQVTDMVLIPILSYIIILEWKVIVKNTHKAPSPNQPSPTSPFNLSYKVVNSRACAQSQFSYNIMTYVEDILDGVFTSQINKMAPICYRGIRLLSN